MCFESDSRTFLALSRDTTEGEEETIRAFYPVRAEGCKTLTANALKPSSGLQDDRVAPGGGGGRLGGDDAVLPLGLRGVEGGIPLLEDLVLLLGGGQGRIHVRAVRSDAHGHRHDVPEVQRGLAGADRHRQESPVVDRLPDLLGDRDGRGEGGAEENHREFVAAIAAGERDGLREGALEDEGDFAEHLAAREVSVNVVDPLEVVAVEEEQSELAVFRLAEPVDFTLELPVEVAVVIERR